MSIRCSIRMAFLGLVAVLLASCAEPPPPPPPPTVVNVTATASADVNPNASGRASPVTVRFFYLVSSTTFEEADFFALFDAAEATLGADLVSNDEFNLGPGQQKTTTRELPDTARSVGVLVSYRDIQSAVWRDVIEVAPNQTTNIDAKVEALAVSLSAAAAP